MIEINKEMTPEQLDAGSTSAKLADLEKAAKEKHNKEIDDVSQKIEALLIENQITWGEFQKIIDAYSQRTFFALSGMTVKSLKDHYDNPIIRL